MNEHKDEHDLTRIRTWDTKVEGLTLSFAKTCQFMIQENSSKEQEGFSQGLQKYVGLSS